MHVNSSDSTNQRVQKTIAQKLTEYQNPKEGTWICKAGKRSPPKEVSLILENEEGQSYSTQQLLISIERQQRRLAVG